jgi:hypothetical protein
MVQGIPATPFQAPSPPRVLDELASRIGTIAPTALNIDLLVGDAIEQMSDQV